MSLLPTIQKILFPRFSPIPGSHFHMENSVWSLAAYQLIWATTCIAGTCTSMEGTLYFPMAQTKLLKQSYSSCYCDWPFPLCSDAQLMGRLCLRAQLYEERRVAVVAGPSSGTTELFCSEHLSVQCSNEN